MKVTVPFTVIEGNIGTESGRGDAGKGADTFEKLSVERFNFLVLVIAGLGQCDFHGKNAGRIETEGSLLRLPETFQSQTSGGQQHESQSNLTND